MAWTPEQSVKARGRSRLFQGPMSLIIEGSLKTSSGCCGPRASPSERLAGTMREAVVAGTSEFLPPPAACLRAAVAACLRAAVAAERGPRVGRAAGTKQGEIASSKDGIGSTPTAAQHLGRVGPSRCQSADQSTPGEATRHTPDVAWVTAHSIAITRRSLRGPTARPDARSATSLRLPGHTSAYFRSDRAWRRATRAQTGLDAGCRPPHARRRNTAGVAAFQTVGGAGFSAFSAVCPGRRWEGRTRSARSSRPAAVNTPISARVAPRKASS